MGVNRSIAKNTHEARALLAEANTTLAALDDKMKQVVTFLQSAANGIASVDWNSGDQASNMSAVAKRVYEDLKRVAEEVEEDESDITSRDIVRFARQNLDSGGDGTLDKQELDDLFEKYCGVKLSVQCLNDVFDACDDGRVPRPLAGTGGLQSPSLPRSF